MESPMLITIDSLLDMEKLRRLTSVPYCDCEFPTKNLGSAKVQLKDIVKCRCGEEEIPEASITEWRWLPPDNGNGDTVVNGKDVIFHPTFSQGTAILRGETPLQEGVHYWEMRMITRLTGTDVMFGVGTDKVDMTKFNFQFVSALGLDTHSWGLSYTGKIQHGGVMQSYGNKFSQGCILGVLLDRTLGFLEFFLNRRSLGVAFKNIPTDPKVKLFPMISATTARSAIRLINSTSLPESLQFRAFKELTKQQHSLMKLHKLPGFRASLRSFWFMQPPSRYSPHSTDNEMDIADEAVLSTNQARKARKACKQKFPDDDENDDSIDLYANAHKIPTKECQDSEDEYIDIGDCYDEYFAYLSAHTE